MATSNETNKLTSAQYKGINSLLSCRDVATAAKEAGIAERTLYRWLNENEDFKVALAEAEAELLATVTRRLSYASNKAIDVLVEVMDDNNPLGNKSAGPRVSAARTVLDSLLKVRE